MPINKLKGSSKKTGKCLLSAVGDFTISTVSENHKVLVNFYTEFSDLEIDLSAVEEIDCSGVQLLLALKHSAEKEGKQLTVTSASAPAKEAMELLNIYEQFNCDDDK